MKQEMWSRINLYVGVDLFTYQVQLTPGTLTEKQALLLGEDNRRAKDNSLIFSVDNISRQHEDTLLLQCTWEHCLVLGCQRIIVFSRVHGFIVGTDNFRV